MSDGSRRVTHITELTGAFSDVISMQDIFLFEKEGLTPNGKGERPLSLAPASSQNSADKLKAAGIPLPTGLLDYSMEV
jgi:pilus assembly protein CpaF